MLMISLQRYSFLTKSAKLKRCQVAKARLNSYSFLTKSAKLKLAQ